MSKWEEKHRKQIVDVARSLHAKDMLAAGDGNISVKLAPECILITPSGLSKARMEPEDIVVANSKGECFSGKASSEIQMHLAIYRNCPQATAVVHAHPPTAIAWTIARPEDKELPATAMSELLLSVGALPIAPYARPGTAAMGEVLVPFLPRHRCLILARHGALSWGEDLEEAHKGMERIEHSAKILRDAVVLGGISEIETKEIEELKKLRAQLGDRTL